MRRPRFSVIVAVAPERTAPVLASLDEMDYPRDRYETIVEPGLNPSVNRNRGIERARGEVLAFVDDDAIVAPGWLRQAEAFLDRHPQVDVVGGPQLTPPTDGYFATVSGFVLASAFGAYKMSSRYRRGAVNLKATQLNLTSANIFMRRTALDAVGVFDPRLFPNEETELLGRMTRAGHALAYSPDIVVYHQRRPTFRGFARQCFGYGTGRARQNWLDRSPPGLGALIPLAFLAYLALSPLLALVAPLLLAPWLIYVASNGAMSVATAIANRRWDAALVLPPLFLTIHIAYPLGIAIETARLILRPERNLARPTADTASGATGLEEARR